MNKWIIIGILAVGLVVFFLVMKNKKDKADAAKTIASHTGAPATSYLSKSLSFLESWANAVIAGQDFFVINGIGYSTKDGSAQGATGD